MRERASKGGTRKAHKWSKYTGKSSAERRGKGVGTGSRVRYQESQTAQDDEALLRWWRR